ncbi:Bifunctional nuclease, partial [Thalictrum thalictroides]
MGTLQGPVSYSYVRANKKVGVQAMLSNGVVMKDRIVLRSGLWGFRGNLRDGIKVLIGLNRVGKSGIIRCGFSSSSDNGSMAENFNENDDEFVNSSVVEADGFMIKMRDGKYMRCIHNSPQGGHLADYAPHPAIVLKMEDGSDLLLPIIV